MISTSPPTIVVFLVFALMPGMGALAEGISQTDFLREKAQVLVEYESSRRACDILFGNAVDICIAEATGAKNLANAKLDARYRPGSESSDRVRVAREDEVYGVASERCGELFGNTRDICLKEAAAAKNSTPDAGTENPSRGGVGDGHRDVPVDPSVMDRRHRVTERMDDDYALELEKCETHAAHDKALCVARVKVRFGKN